MLMFGGFFYLFLGSLFGSKAELKNSCKVAAKYCFYLQLVGMWMTFMFLVPGCNDINIPESNGNR
jgi:hypothetical protein